jgi:hypothetical protein
MPALEHYLYFLFLIPFYLLTVGVRVIVSRDYTQWHSHTRQGLTAQGINPSQSRDLYLTTHNTHKRHSCPRRDSKRQSQATERPQSHASNQVATGFGIYVFYGLSCHTAALGALYFTDFLAIRPPSVRCTDLWFSACCRLQCTVRPWMHFKAAYCKFKILSVLSSGWDLNPLRQWSV